MRSVHAAMGCGVAAFLAAGEARAQEMPSVLEPITVEGRAAGGSPLAADGYVPKTAQTGSKTDTPITEVPQSISSVTRAQLDDRNVQTLSDALTYTPGVRVGAFGFDPRFDSFYVRGFDATYEGIYRDGLRELNGSFSIFKTEPYGLDGVTVLKGPSSTLYGAGSPGGIVDLVSKRPTVEPVHDVWLQVGNHDRYQGQMDLGGALVSDGTLSYRLTGLGRDSNTGVWGVKDNRGYIAPALTWAPNADTSLTLLSEYSKSRTGGDAAYYQGNERGKVSKLIDSDPAYNRFDQEQYRIGYAFEHRFDEVFRVRQNFRYAHIDADVGYAQIDGISDDGLTALRSTGRIHDKLDSYVLDNQAQADFATGPLTHKLLAGVDLAFVGATDRIGFGSAPDLDLVDLNYGEQHIDAPDLNAVDTRQKQRQIGLYLQDQAKWGPWILTLGGRHDWLRTHTLDRMAHDRSVQKDDKFSGRAGLTYETDFGLSPYASYSTSFSPTLGTAQGGAAFRPTSGRQTELGVKYAPPGVNALVTAAVFRIDQKNVLRTDPDNMAFQIQTGKIRARGFELEVQASLAEGLNLTAGYAYLDQKIVRGDEGVEGNFPSGIPRNSASLWVDYGFAGTLRGLSLGTGLRYTGKSWGDDENTFRNNDYLIPDAAVAYDFGVVVPSLKGMELQVNARNLFDKDVMTCQAGYCYRDEGRTVIAGLRYRW